MEGFADHRVKEVRIMGGCVCVEVKDSGVLKGYQQFAYERGVFSRPFLNCMYAMVSGPVHQRLIRIVAVKAFVHPVVCNSHRMADVTARQCLSSSHMSGACSAVLS